MLNKELHELDLRKTNIKLTNTIYILCLLDLVESKIFFAFAFFSN